MFEDQNQNQITPQPSGGGVEDIFAGTDAAGSAAAHSSAFQAPSPALPGPPTALEGGKLKPLDGNAPGIPALQASSGSGAGFPFKKLCIIVFLSLGIIGAGAAAFTVLQRKGSAPPFAVPLGQPQEVAPAPAVAPDVSAPEAAPEEIPDAAASSPPDTSGILKSFQQGQIDRALNPIPQDLASVDTDQDGLSDAQEFGYGTNPRLVDSDNDGLSDWEETAIFGTDPLNVDSDADSYLDGEEVQNGYNPLGAGKLLNFEKATEAAE